MKRFFTPLLGALAMLAVALVSAFITMRLAIHGREAIVPALTGLTVEDARSEAAAKGLNLAIEERFYSSDVLAGRVIAQDPAPGMRVRRDWPVRITESLGGQRVSIPDLTGESERAATVSVRRLALELGIVGHLTVGGDPDVVIAQTPPANATGIVGPRVSFLVSDAGPGLAQQAYAMPSLTGLTYSAALERASAAGLRLIVSTAAPATVDAATTPAATLSAAAVPGVSLAALAPAPAAAPPAPVAPSTSGIIISQWPQPGSRVAPGDAAQVTFSHPAQAPMPVP